MKDNLDARTGTVLCLVGCSKTKLSRPAPARELYCSPLFQLSRRWAKRHATAWAILSARHGVVAPEKVLEPYDARAGGSGLGSRLFRGWLYAAVQAWICRWASRYQYPPLVILAGKDYWECLAGRIPFTVPLDGLGIGRRLRWLKEQTR
jgi:hypothetical protein